MEGTTLRTSLSVMNGPQWLSQYSDGLRTGRSWDRIPVKARFSAHVQTVPGTQPAFHTMVTGSFPGVKRPGRGVDHPLLSSAEVKERVELDFYSPSGSSWPVLGGNLSLCLLSVMTLLREDTCRCIIM